MRIFFVRQIIKTDNKAVVLDKMRGYIVNRQ